VLAVPEDSPFASSPPQGLQVLAEEPFVLFPRRLAPAYHDAVMARFSAAGFEPNIVQEVYNESAALSLVAVGMGVTIMPESARHRCPASVRLVLLPGFDLKVTLDLVWRADRDEHPLILRLVEAAKAAGENDSAAEGAPAQGVSGTI
jgi:DNA-binding transcriptional LysR family regulator